MKDKVRDKELRDELRAEYSFGYAKALRDKYSRRFMAHWANAVVLDPDVVEASHDGN
jgi:hypothetical protein